MQSTSISQRRKRLFIVLALAVGMVGAAGVAAVAAAFDAYRYYRAHQSNIVGPSFIMEDPVVGYVQRPHIHNRYTSPPVYDLYTDDMGARVAKPGLRSPRKVDLLAVGDSFTWGHGVQDESTYVKRLAAAKGLTASNVALASYGLTTSYLSFRRFSFLEPDIVIFGFIEDNITRALQPCAPSLSPYCRAVPFVDFDAGGNPFIHPPEYRSADYYRYMQDVIMEHPFGWKDIVWGLKRDRLILSGNDRDGINRRHGRHVNDSAARQKAVEFIVASLVQEVRGQQAALVFVHIPSMSAVAPLPPEFASIMSKRVDNDRVFFVETATAFDVFVKEHGSRPLMAGGVDAHPSELAHEMIALELAPVIDQIRGTPRP
jgi:hypothetical protein